MVQLSRLRILLFTFDEGSLTRLKQRLIHQGALVSSVDTAKKVPRFIKSVPMHLLVVDSATAEDAIALIRSVRALGLRSGGDLPAILLTDEEPKTFSASTGDNGFHVIMKKPVAPDVLLQTVQSLTEKHPAARFRDGVLATKASAPAKARAGSAA
jgi:DNA-binding response OmpR family regulator